MTFRKLGLLGLTVVAGVLAACEGDTTVVVPPDTTSQITVAVVPQTATILIGGTQQLTAVVTGTTNQAVTWSSSADAIATVSATGLVTGRTAGTAVISAVSTVSATARAAAAVTVNAVPTPSIVITSITTGTTLTPVNPQNVTGQIDITAELNVPQGAQVSRIEFLLDNVVQANCTQQFTAGGSADLETDAAMVPVLCSINTAAFVAATGNPTFPNGPHRVSVQVVSPAGTVVASTGQDLRFNNPNFITIGNFSGVFSKVCVTSTTNPGPGSLAPGQLWCGGNLAFTMTPTIFTTAADRPNSYTITLTTVGSGVNGTAGCNAITLAGCGAVGITKTTSAGDTVTFVGGTVSTTSTADIAAVEEILASIAVASVTAAGQAGPVCVNPDPARNPLNVCGTGLPGGTAPNIAFTPNPVRLDNLPPRSNLFDLTVATLSCTTAGATGCFVNGSFSFAERTGFFTTVDFGVDGQTASFRAGATVAAFQTVTTGNDLAETSVPSLMVAGITTDRLANSDTLFASTTAATPIQSPTAGTPQLIGIDKTNPRILSLGAVPPTPGNNSANAGNTYTITFVDTSVVPAGPSGFSNNPVRVKLERITSTGTVCLSPNAPSGTVSCTTNAGFVADDGAVVIPPTSPTTDGYYRITARVVDEAGNTSTPDSLRLTLIDGAVPTTGGVVAPSAIVGGQSASFTASVNDNVDLGDVKASVGYGATVLGFPPTTIGTYGPDAFVISTNASVTIASFTRGIEGTTAAGRPTGGPVVAATIQFDVRDAAGVQNNLACPGLVNCASSPLQAISTNVIAGGAPVSYTVSNPVFTSANAAHGNFLLAAPTNATVCNGSPLGVGTQPCPTNPTSTTLVATVTGPTGSFNNPFARVEFYYIDAIGRAQFIGNGAVGAQDNTILGFRVWSFTLVWTPAGIPAAATSVFALGVNTTGDGLQSALQGITIAID